MKQGSTTTQELRARRHARVRSRIIGTEARPRLAVYRSNRFVSAQLIDDGAGKTIAAAHGRDFSAKGGSASGGKLSQTLQAAAVGEAIAKQALAAKITTIVFDRGGFRYAGQVKALADAARAAGLTF